MSSQKCFSLVLFRAFVYLFFKTCNHLISKAILVFIAFGSVIKVFSICTSGYVLLCTGAFCNRLCWFLCNEAAAHLSLAYLHLLDQKLKGFVGSCHQGYAFFLTSIHRFLNLINLILFNFNLAFLIFSSKLV